MEENKGTPLIPDDMPEEIAPEDLLIPTRAELEARQAKEGEDDKGVEDGEEDKLDGDKPDGEADKGSEDDKGTDDEPSVTQEAYQATLEDPGEYVPEDYSFEVTVYDEDNKNPKTVKVGSPEDFEKLLDEDKNFGSASALMRAQRMATKMESKADADKVKWEQTKREFTDQQTQVTATNEAIQKTANELNYLVSKGKLPEVPKKYQNADWTDPAVAKQPGVKEQLELLNYMGKENEARRKAGLSDLTPSTALTEMRAEVAEKALKDNESKAGEARRQAGARVAGSTPAPASAAPKGVSVGRSFGDLSNLSDMRL